MAGDDIASVVHVGSPLKHPAGNASGSVTLVVDGDIVEVCLGSNLAAYRMPRYLGSDRLGHGGGEADHDPSRRHPLQRGAQHRPADRVEDDVELRTLRAQARR